mmetsp:Transcript_104534/g.223435  ORF Transcript_104534/g.223435 Transcript_104534/m.223435 type:complete len:306 (-) Transcript_104534:75-992(-)
MRQATTTQNLVNIAWALDTLKCRDLEGEALHNMLHHFTNHCADSLGVEWVSLAAIAEDHGLTSRVPHFLEQFQERILEPALTHLGAVRRAPDEGTLAAAFRRFQEWVVDLQVPHLGAVHTHQALVAAGALAPGHDCASWIRRAREAVAGAAWWSCPHAMVSSQGVVAWVSAHLEVSGGACVEEPGRVFFADDSAEHSILVERMVQPIFLQVPRNGHAERRALITLLRAVSRAFGQGASERWEETRGSVELYASHYLCISCLASVAQFSRRMPSVALHVEFDNAWAAWEERDVPTGDGVFTIGRAV